MFLLDDKDHKLTRRSGLSNNRDLQAEQKERSGELNDTEILECPATDAAPTIMMSQCTCEDGTFFAIWQQALGRYTARDLSDPADKLPAFAGFAEVCSRVRADQYLAGLWRRRLIHDMMWTARPPPLSAPKPDQRRQAWRAPSWSWACIDAAIDVVGAHKRILETPFDNCPVISQLEATKILDCEVRLQDDQNPFGAVQGGYLEVKGPLIKAKLVPTPYFTRLHIEGSSMQLGNSAFEKLVSQDMFATPHLDLVVYKNPDLEGFGNEQDGWDVWCLQMREEVVRSKLTLPGRSQPGPITLMDGLVLLPTDGTLTGFRRIGVWVTDWRVVVEPYQHPFRGVQLRTIKLV